MGAFSYDLRFPGQYFDPATYLHYNYFRDYDPRLGRYIESDPIGLAGGINTYAYAGGNPLKNVDPNGEGFVDCAKALADLVAATKRLVDRLDDKIEHKGKPDPMQHDKAIQQAANQVNKELAKVKNSCACVVDAAAAIEAAEIAIEAAAPYLLVAPFVLP